MQRIIDDLTRNKNENRIGIDLNKQTIDWLIEFQACVHIDPIQVSALLFPHKAECGFVTDAMIRATESLGNYARVRSRLLETQQDGDVERAERLQELCDLYFDQLPEWARF